jgi:hypothetical protein
MPMESAGSTHWGVGEMQSVYAALRKDIGPHCFAPRMYLAQDREESLAGTCILAMGTN